VQRPGGRTALLDGFDRGLIEQRDVLLTTWRFKHAAGFVDDDSTMMSVQWIAIRGSGYGRATRRMTTGAFSADAAQWDVRFPRVWSPLKAERRCVP